MTWGDLIGEICRKVLVAVAKVLLFIILMVTSVVEILAREINGQIRKYLFPNRR